MNDVDIATHDEPVWREQANFIIMADLSDHGMQGRWEQLWARQMGEDEFIVCCIPFFTYGIALGDRVLTNPREERRYVIDSVSERSGRRVLRLWVKDVCEAARPELAAFVEEQHLLLEWYSRNLLSLDVPGEPEIFERIQLFLRHFVERHGALMESGG